MLPPLSGKIARFHAAAMFLLYILHSKYKYLFSLILKNGKGALIYISSGTEFRCAYVSLMYEIHTTAAGVTTGGKIKVQRRSDLV